MLENCNRGKNFSTFYHSCDTECCRLKKDKEEERKLQETAAKELIEPRDPLTGESSIEALVREIEEHKFVRQKVHENEQRIKKQREMER